MAESVSIAVQKTEPTTYEPLPGERDFFVQIWGDGDAEKAARFAHWIMYGDPPPL